MADVLPRRDYNILHLGPDLGSVYHVHYGKLWLIAERPEYNGCCPEKFKE